MEFLFPSDMIDYHVDMTAVLIWCLGNVQFSDFLQMGMPCSYILRNFSNERKVFGCNDLSDTQKYQVIKIQCNSTYFCIVYYITALYFTLH